MAERTCIATGQTVPPHKLIRFVAAPDGYAVADLAGRLPGRGAWVTAEESVIRKADQKGHLKRALGVGLKSFDVILPPLLLGYGRASLPQHQWHAVLECFLVVVANYYLKAILKACLRRRMLRLANLQK